MSKASARSIDTIFEALSREIEQHPSNAGLTQLGYLPLFSMSPAAKIVIIGQAPGKKAQESGIVWNDASGIRLMSWLGVSEEVFRDPSIVAHIPMDFYYPGKGASGDLPPRKDFADLWHKKIMEHMPSVELVVLIGQYAQKYYLGKRRHSNLTETVRNYDQYLPDFFPLVHPSPLNFRWFANHAWFEAEVVPELRATVQRVLSDASTRPVVQPPSRPPLP